MPFTSPNSFNVKLLMQRKHEARVLLRLQAVHFVCTHHYDGPRPHADAPAGERERAVALDDVYRGVHGRRVVAYLGALGHAEERDAAVFGPRKVSAQYPRPWVLSQP